jgi:hypothetical protein
LAHGIVRCQHQINYEYEGRALQPILGAMVNFVLQVQHEIVAMVCRTNYAAKKCRLVLFGHLAGSVLALHLDLAVSVDFEKLLAEQQAK